MPAASSLPQACLCQLSQSRRLRRVACGVRMGPSLKKKKGSCREGKNRIGFSGRRNTDPKEWGIRFAFTFLLQSGLEENALRKI